MGSGTIKSARRWCARLPAGVDGSWQVDMNLQPPGGSGSILLPNGRTLQANPVVTFSARSGLECIKLSGTGTDRGTTLNINLFPATNVWTASAEGSLAKPSP